MRVATEEREFEFELSDARLAEIAREVGVSLHRVKELEEQLAAAKEEAKAIGGLMQAVREQGVLIDRGTEKKSVVCEWRYDEPEAGLKSLYRSDTDELVEGSVGEMSDEEKQGELFVGEEGLGSVDNGKLTIENEEQKPWKPGDETGVMKDLKKKKPDDDEMNDPNLKIPENK